jgi:hypothetical protein
VAFENSLQLASLSMTGLYKQKVGHPEKFKPKQYLNYLCNFMPTFTDTADLR